MASWLRLISKEWGEQRRRAFWLTALLLAIQGMSFLFGVDIAIDVFCQIAMYYSVPVAVWLAIDVAVGERADDLLSFSRSLPVRARAIVGAKLVVAAWTAALPILAAALLVAAAEWAAPGPFYGADGMLRATFRGIAMHLDIGPSGAALYMGLVSAWSTVCVLLWCVAAAVNRPNRLQAGVASLGMLFVSLLFLGLTEPITMRLVSPASELFNVRFDFQDLFAVVNGFGPAGSLLCLTMSFDSQSSTRLMLNVHLAVALMQLVVAALLTARILHAYGSFGTPTRKHAIQKHVGWLANRFQRFVDRAAGQLGPRALPPPRSRPATALAWQQWRQSAPLCFLSLTVVFSFTAVTLLAWAIEHRPSPDALFREAANMAMQGGLLLGLFASLVSGIATFTAELRPRLDDFWRSRPIPPSLWFWTKYLVGLATVLVTLHGPFIVYGLLSGGVERIVASPFYGCAIVMYLLTYTVGVGAACLLRQPIAAGLAASGVSLAVLLFPTLLSERVHDVWGLVQLPWTAYVHVPFVTLALGVAFAASVGAWLAAVHNFDIYDLLSRRRPREGLE